MATAKPSIGFITGNNNNDLAAKVDSIVGAMTNNQAYPQSGIADVATQNAAFKTAITTAADGSRQARVDLKAKRTAMNDRMRTLANYVQLHCNNDMPTLVSSGFPAQKTTRTPATIPPAPVVRSVAQGPWSGSIAMKIRSLRAMTYNWRYYAATTPETMFNAPQTTTASTVFTDLTPGQAYYFQCSAVNTAGTGEWSTPYLQIVT